MTDRMMRYASVLHNVLAVGFVLGCRVAPAPPPSGVSIERWVDSSGLRGVSGVTGHGDDFVVVQERSREVALIRPQGMTLEVRRLPLVGVPDGVDTEDIAWLGDARYVMGTEGQAGDRPQDDLLYVDASGDAAAVVGRIPISYADLYGKHAKSNHGIEGVCAVGDTVLAAMEWVDERDGARYAPLVRYEHGVFTPYRVALTSDAGKLSAIACRRHAGGVELAAIERHYAVARLLRFQLDGPVLHPTMVLDLAPLFPQQNLEGLAFADDGFFLVNDNDSGGIRGPSELIHIRLR